MMVPSIILSAAFRIVELLLPILSALLVMHMLIPKKASGTANNFQLNFMQITTCLMTIKMNLWKIMFVSFTG